MIYADTTRGMPTCLSYAKAKHPLGPYKKGGVIIDNNRCDREAWNNHGSIFCLKDQWYIAYHRATLGQGACGNRRVCLEPISFDEEGNIQEVLMTTQGVEPPLNAKKKIEAFRACEFYWKPKETIEEMIQNSFFMKRPLEGWRKRIAENTVHEGRMSGVRTAHQIVHDMHHEYLTEFQDGDGAVYRYLDFGEGVHRFRCSASAYLSVTYLDIRLDSPDGQVMGTVTIDHTGGWGSDWKEFSCDLLEIKGVHTLYLMTREGHEGHRLCDLDWFVFE